MRALAIHGGCGVLADLAPYRIGAGLMALDAGGSVAAPFNTAGMFRGWVMADGSAAVATHAELFPVAL